MKSYKDAYVNSAIYNYDNKRPQKVPPNSIISETIFFNYDCAIPIKPVILVLQEDRKRGRNMRAAPRHTQASDDFRQVVTKEQV